LGILSAIGIQLPVVPQKRYRLIGTPAAGKKHRAVSEYVSPSPEVQRNLDQSEGCELEVLLSVFLASSRRTSAGDAKEFPMPHQFSVQTIMHEIRRQFTRFLPGYSSIRFDRVSSRFDPIILDGMPIVGPVPNAEGLYLALYPRDNKGMLAPAIGATAARLIMTGKSSEEMKMLSPERFPQTAPGGQKRVTD
jgi:glycine/D-amino acid oxidase-like deaminating enzyme